MPREHTLLGKFPGKLSFTRHKSSQSQKHNLRSFLVEKSAERGVPLGKERWGSFRAGTHRGVLLPVGQDLPGYSGCTCSLEEMILWILWVFWIFLLTFMTPERAPRQIFHILSIFISHKMPGIGTL